MQHGIGAFVGGVLVAASAFLPGVSGTNSELDPNTFLISTSTGMPILVAGAVVAAAALASRFGFVARGFSVLIALHSLAVAGYLTAMSALAPLEPVAGPSVEGSVIATAAIDIRYPDVGLGLFIVGSILVLAWASRVVMSSMRPNHAALAGPGGVPA